MDTHTIRLRGPWECEIAGTVKRIHMPAAVSAVIDSASEGRLLCRRRFGCPTCLDPHEVVWLVIEAAILPCEVRLNGESLGAIDGASGSAEFDVTRRLRERNELLLDFDAARIDRCDSTTDSQFSSDKSLFTDVRLEIRG